MRPCPGFASDTPRHRGARPARDPAVALAFHERRRLADDVITGLEAQARWPGLRAGIVIGPALDASPLASEAVATLLANACHYGVTHDAAGLISITLPDWFIGSGPMLETAARALEETGLPPERLEIAIGEAGLDSHCTDTLLALSALRDLGVGVAMDGFGRRDASLLTLKRLPLSAVKLDCALVADAAYDPGARALIAAASGFAHRLDMNVVAAAPDEALRGVLRHAGCDEVVERARDRDAFQLWEAGSVFGTA